MLIIPPAGGGSLPQLSRSDGRNSRRLSYGRMPDPQRIRQSSTVVFSVLMIVIGIALLARTIAAGGGVATTGVLLGVLFVAAGVGRLFVQSRGP